jgi:hypothetical protein
LIGNAGYVYDERYFVDATLSQNGGSSFGDNSRWQKFYSIGGGWNVHNEKFFNITWINQLRLKYTFGVSGSSNYVTPYQAMFIYTYPDNTESLYHGSQGAYMLQYGNPDLGWQEVFANNAEFNLQLFDGRAQLTGTWYKRVTKNADMLLSLGESHGYESYMANAGEKLNRGWEVKVSGTLLSSDNWSINAFANFANNEERITSISEAMEEELKNQSIYSSGSSDNLWYILRDGQSQRAIYAIESWGVDPMTGRRIFLNTAGLPQLYSTALGDFPRVYIGDGNPTVNGSASLSVRYKGLSVAASFSYNWGGMAVNYTALNKVEQPTWYHNIDRRVYSERWRKPGDLSKYRALTANDTKSYISS